jgi:hypothetical protein
MPAIEIRLWVKLGHSQADNFDWKVTMANGPKVFLVDRDHRADYKVLLVDQPHKEKNAQLLANAKLVQREHEADLKLFIVDRDFKADIKIQAKNFPRAK